MDKLIGLVTSGISFVESHKALIATVVLAYHTIAKGISDSLKANAEKKGADKLISVFGDVLTYIFAGQRS